MKAQLPSLDQFEFHQVIERTQGIVLAMFTAPGCGACRRWRVLLAELEGKRADMQVFEVDAARDLALAREFEVFHLPALFLFVDGVYHCALHSEAHPARLEAALRHALAAPAEEAP
ncbi:MAG: thioredoxin family protein [Gammaproteobacteria bacterium]